MARALLVSTVALVLAATGCESDAPRILDPFDLAPAPGRGMLGGGHAYQLSPPGGVASVPSGAAPGEMRQLQIDLPGALAAAGARSVEVRFAEARLDETRQSIYAAWGSLFPSVMPGVLARAHRDALQKSTGEFVEVTKQAEFGGVAALAQWQPGTVVFRALSAARRTDAAEAATDTARAENAVRVAEAYYELVRARTIVRIADQALEEARGLAHDEDAKEKRGAGILADVLRAQAEVSQKELLRAQADVEVATASARLVALLQLEPSVELVPTDDAPLPVVLVSNDVPLEQLLSRAESTRPELHESQALIDAARREHEGVKWGPLVPEVDGGVQTGVLGPTFGQTTETNDFVAAVGWKIGPGGLFDIPAINAAAARVRQARVRDEGIHVEIAREVVEARARAIAADREIASARNGVIAASEALRLQKLRFEKGAGIVLEVLDAQRALTFAQTAEVEAIVHFDRAQYRLLRAIGDPIEAVKPPR